MNIGSNAFGETWITLSTTITAATRKRNSLICSDQGFTAHIVEVHPSTTIDETLSAFAAIE